MAITVSRPNSFLGRIFGDFTGWFNPGQPLTPTAPFDTPPRAYDYPITQNMTFTPRGGKAQIGFRELRNLADGCYLMRVIIEKMKDRICAKDWHFQLKAEPGEIDADRADRSAKDPRIKALTEFFQYPDQIHGWKPWLRMLLEQQLVIDAATLEVQRNGAGKIVNLLPVDGATINVLIDNTGRTPQYPTPAYQQIVQGLPATDFTVRDLVYMPRNLRVHRVYGFSPVEQTLLLMQTYIMRTIHVLNMHDESNIPAGFVPMPPETSADEATRFMANLNATIDGDLANKTRLFPVWGGAGEVQLLKAEDPLQKFDEWAAKIFCFAIGETASPLTASNNRATAQQNDDTREESGEAPVMDWVREQINAIVQRPDLFNGPDIEFAWIESVDTDALKQAQIDQINIAIGTRTPNELRARDGLPDLTPEQLDELAPPPPPAVAGGFDPQTGKPVQPPGKKQPKPVKNDDQTAGTAKADAGKKKLRVTIDPSKAHETQTAATLEAILARFLADQGEAIGKQLADAYAAAPAQKADDAPDTDALIRLLTFQAWEALIPQIEQQLDDAGVGAVADVFAQIAAAPSTYESLFRIANTEARDYAADRAAELVGKRRVDGQLVTSPNAKWAITDSTREDLRAEVTKAFADNITPQELAGRIAASPTFDPARAKMIARTETAMAQTAASVKTSSLFGATGKSTQISNIHDKDDVCDDAQEQGVIGLGEVYPNGALHVPLHPSCNCVELMHWD